MDAALGTVCCIFPSNLYVNQNQKLIDLSELSAFKIGLCLHIMLETLPVVPF